MSQIVVGDEVCFQPQRQILDTTITVLARNLTFNSALDFTFELLYFTLLSH